MDNTIVKRFPSELVSNAEKDSFDFGFRYASAIWYEWENKIELRNNKFKKLRLYARGEHPIEQCKSNMGGENINLKFLSVDWTSRVKFMPRFLRKAYNGIDMSQFMPEYYAIDPDAMTIKKKRKDEKVKLFNNKEFLQEIQQVTGESPIPLESIPNSMEQIELEEATSKPLAIETAEELAVTGIAKENSIYSIYDKIERNIHVEGLGVAEVFTDSIEGIKLNYIKPDEFIHSDTTDPEFRDCNYFGKVKKMTVREAKRIASQQGVDLPDEVIREYICETAVNEVNDYHTLKYLSYTFLTYNEEVLKVKRNRKNNAISIIDRTKDVGTDKEYKPKADSDISKKVRKTYDVWYEGIMLIGNIGDHKIIKHCVAENMAKSRTRILPRYIAVAPRIDEFGYNSITEETMGNIDRLQELDFRIQHFRNKLRGTVSSIDPSVISTTKLGNRLLTPQEWLEFYFSLDISFDKTVDEEGDPIDRKQGVREQDPGIPRALMQLIEEFSREYNLFVQQWGYSGSDESKPSDKTLTEGEVYRFSDNLTMKDYSDNMYYFALRMYQCISSRLDDIFKDSDLKDKYANMIGMENIELMDEYVKRRENHWFLLMMDIVPTQSERLSYLQKISLYVQQGIIDPLDEEQLVNSRNIKNGLRLLRLRIEERQRKAMEEQQQKQDIATNGNIQSAKASSEFKQQTMQLEYQLKDIQAEKDLQRKATLLKLETQAQMQLEGIKMDVKVQNENYNKQWESEMQKYKKDRDEDTRLKAISKSKEEEANLVKLRKGLPNPYDDNTNTNDVNLDSIINQQIV